MTFQYGIFTSFSKFRAMHFEGKERNMSLVHFGKNFDFEIRKDHGKKSYERRVYESVDDKSLY